jgi:hypothetical protein
MNVPLSLMRHKQHTDSVGEKCIVLNKKYSFTVLFQGSVIYNKWEFIQWEKIYVGVLKVPMQFLKLSALRESRSLECSDSAQYHRSHIFQRNSKYLTICLVNFDTIIWRFNSGRRSVWSLNGGQCHILHCKLFSGCSRWNAFYAADNAQFVAS